MLWLVLAYGSGILAASVFPLAPVTAYWAAILNCAAVVIGSVKSWRGNCWLFLCLFILLGFTSARLALTQSGNSLVGLAGQQATVEGAVIQEPDVRPDKVYYLVRVCRVKTASRTLAVDEPVQVTVEGRDRVYRYGDLLSLRGIILQPPTPGNPGQFDYRAYLARQGIGVTLLVQKADRDVQYLGPDPRANGLYRLAFMIRDKLAGIIDQTMSAASGAVVKGVMLGIRGEIPAETNQAFMTTGIVHILSVSGFHVGILLAALLGLRQLLGAGPQLDLLLAVPVLLVYLIMTGLGPAVVRAGVMAGLLLLANRLERPADWPTAMALAALVVLLGQPLLLFDVGFQLSFLATWGLFYLTPVLLKWLSFLPRPVGVALAAPLAAQLATLPVVVRYFNLLSPVSLLANLVALPLVSVIMLIGVVALGVGLIYLPLAGIINISTGVLTGIFMQFVLFFSKLPGAAIYLAAPSPAGVILWYGLLVGAVELAKRPERQFNLVKGLERYRKQGFTALTVIGLLVLVWVWWPGPADLTVHFIDVGQGDSTLLQLPHGKNVLVDTGGWPGEFADGQGAGNKVVLPYLHRLGLNRLDMLVLTHCHEDHAGGAMAVIKALPVDLVVVSPYGMGPEEQGVDPHYTALLKTIKQKGIKLLPVQAGDQLAIDPAVQMRVLSPGRSFTGTHSDPNNNAVVLRLVYQDRSLLLGADVEREAQQEILDSGQYLKSEILKVPHHGSKYSLPEFFQKVAPELAVISVGARNSFGQPSPETVAVLQGAGVKVLRTDRDGAVVVKSNAAGWSIAGKGRP